MDKAVGKLAQLETVLPMRLGDKLGIGLTRWSTHRTLTGPLFPVVACTLRRLPRSSRHLNIAAREKVEPMKISQTEPEHSEAIEPAAPSARTGTRPSGSHGAWSFACTVSATRLAAGLLLGVALCSTVGRSVAQTAQHTLPLFPDAGQSQQGLARISNHSDRAGTVTIFGTDDAGQRRGPVTLSLSARQTRHFGSQDLESGNALSGLRGSLGDGSGDWRLELTTELDIEPAAYIHATDGFPAPMHDIVRTVEDGSDTVHRVPIFNPGSNGNEVSWLRLVNLTDTDVDVTIRGRDDSGSSPPGGEVRLTLPAGGARSISAYQLESGDDGLTGRFGDGTGRWQLLVTATGAIEVGSLLQTSAGHIVNLSASGLARTTPSGGHSLPLFPAAGQSRQGLARIINHSDQAGTVTIFGTDDAGQRRGPVTLSLSARQSRHLDSQDLETGNASRGLTGSLGDGDGDWRLELTTDLDIEPSAYVRTEDGVLAPMHDVVRTVEVGSDTVHRVPIFNPGSNGEQVSWLRLVNLTDASVEVTVRGRDDSGSPPPGGEVRLTLPAGGARSISAQQLESGDDGLTGRFGDGTGRWQLFVTATGSIEVVSLLQTNAGHWINLSATPDDAESDATNFTYPDQVPGQVPDQVPFAAKSSGDANPVSAAPNLGDFNGDGRDDVLLRRADGRWYYYPMNGRFHIRAQRGTANLTTNLDWRPAGIGDFNGDGRDDMLLRRADGRWYYYPMNGRSHIRAQRGTANLTTNLDWRPAGIGDFNGDGRDDVLLRRADGRWYYYPMNGRFHIRAQRGTANLTTNLDWRPAGIGDFNGDGRDDVLLRHADGRWYYYPMNGRSHIRAQRGTANLTTNLDWRLAGIGDFNGDGRDDVLLRHADGRWYYYPMNGRSHIGAQRGTANLTTNLDWRPAGIGDLNRDGRDDVLLRHASGRWYYYPMNGRANISAQRGTASLTTNLEWSPSPPDPDTGLEAGRFRTFVFEDGINVDERGSGGDWTVTSDMDDNGHVHIAWVDLGDGSGDKSVRYCRFDGSSLKNCFSLFSANDIEGVDIAVDNTGVAHIVYHIERIDDQFLPIRTGNYAIMYSQVNGSEAFTRQVSTNPNDPDSDVPALYDAYILFPPYPRVSVNEFNSISVWYESDANKLNNYDDHHIEATSHDGRAWSHKSLFNTSGGRELSVDIGGYSVPKVTRSVVSPHFAGTSGKLRNFDGRTHYVDVPFFTVGLRPACLVTINTAPCDPEVPEIEYKRTEMSDYIGPDMRNEEIKLFYADDTVQMAWWHSDTDPLSDSTDRVQYIVHYGLLLREATRLNMIRLKNYAAGNFLPCTADPVTGTFACLYQTYEGGQRAIMVFDEGGDGTFDEVELGPSRDVGVVTGRQSLNVRNNVMSFVGGAPELHVTIGRLN